jgi:hypothetical protein
MGIGGRDAVQVMLTGCDIEPWYDGVAVRGERVAPHRIMQHTLAATK